MNTNCGVLAWQWADFLTIIISRDRCYSSMTLFIDATSHSLKQSVALEECFQETGCFRVVGDEIVRNGVCDLHEKPRLWVEAILKMFIADQTNQQLVSLKATF